MARGGIHGSPKPQPLNPEPESSVTDQGLDDGEPRQAAVFERLAPLCGASSSEPSVGSRREWIKNLKLDSKK